MLVTEELAVGCYVGLTRSKNRHSLAPSHLTRADKVALIYDPSPAADDALEANVCVFTDGSRCILSVSLMFL